MAGEIQKAKSFEDRMLDRIRDSIGELMTDDELKKIIERGVDKVFFEPLELRDGYSSHQEKPLIHGILTEILKPQVQAAVNVYMKENKDKLAETIEEIIKRGMGAALMDAITWQFQNDLQNFQTSIMSTIQQR